jgi:hypothetical protein
MLGQSHPWALSLDDTTSAWQFAPRSQIAGQVPAPGNLARNSMVPYKKLNDFQIAALEVYF